MKRPGRWVLLGLLAAIALGLAAIFVMSRSTRGLRAEIVVRNEDYGIPGITKTYEARLTNSSIAPVAVTRCNFVDDAMHHGTMVAYAVQRWNKNTNHWKTVMELGKEDFCKPYPLGIVRASVVQGWLRPGQSLRTGPEATAARNVFNVGDRARFLVFPRDAGDYRTAIATSEFIIDEHPTSNTIFRVAH